MLGISPTQLHDAPEPRAREARGGTRCRSLTSCASSARRGRSHPPSCASTSGASPPTRPSPAQVPSGRPPRLTWRRLLARRGAGRRGRAAAGAAVLLSPSAPPGSQTLARRRHRCSRRGSGAGPAARSVPFAQATHGASSNPATVPAPSPNRVQRITTSLELRVANAQAVSDGTKQAVAIAQSLGGYPSSLDVNAAGRTGYAEITLRIPKQHVQARRSPGSRRSARSSARTSRSRTSRHRSTRRRARSPGSRAELAAWQAAAPDRPRRRQHIAALTTQIAKLQRPPRRDDPRLRATRPSRLELTTRPAPAPVHHRPGPPARPRRRLPLARDRRRLRARARRAARAPARRSSGSPRARLRRHREDEPAQPVVEAQPVLICAKTRKVGSPTGSSPNSGLTQPVSSEREA